MESYKREFIKFLEDAGVLKFGDFTAKSGRKIPYFINAGDIKTGEQIQKLGEFYAKAYFEKVDGIVINPGAFTHYSYAILDAIKSINIPTIEVHLTNINEREEFRKVSVIRNACLNTFMGKHFESYKDALDYLTKYLNEVKINEK